MNELDPINLPNQIPTEQNVRYPKTQIGMPPMNKPHAGMTLWAINVKTFEIDKAKYEAVSLPKKETTINPLPMKRLTGNLAKRSQLTIEREAVHMRVQAKEGIYYCWALNKRTAINRFKKDFGLK